MDMNTLTVFLGWCTVINLAMLIISTVIYALFKNSIAKLHGMLFNINEEDINLIYYKYLGGYKIGIILLNLVPYIALKVMN